MDQGGGFFKSIEKNRAREGSCRTPCFTGERPKKKSFILNYQNNRKKIFSPINEKLTKAGRLQKLRARKEYYFCWSFPRRWVLAWTVINSRNLAKEQQPSIYTNNYGQDNHRQQKPRIKTELTHIRDT